MDEMNDLTKADGTREADTEVHMVYMGLKPLKDRLLNQLIEG